MHRQLTERARPLRLAAEQVPLALIALGVLLYSTGPVMVRASTTTGPVFSFWRLWIGVGVAGAVYAAYRRLGGRAPDRAGVAAAARTGVVFGLHQLLFMSAVKLASVADVTLIATLSPVVTGVLALPMFGERPPRRFWAWSVVAMAGAATVVTAAGAAPEVDPLGVVLALANTVVFAQFFLMSKRHRDTIDVVPFLAVVIPVGALTVSAYVLLAGEPIARVTTTDLILAAATAVGPGFLGHFVMTWPLKWVPANIPPVMRLATPFVAGGLAWLTLGEPLGWRHVAGGLVTIVGVWGALRVGVEEVPPP